MRRSEQGYAMPLGSSPYQEPPFPAGRNAELLLAEFEADVDGMGYEVPEPLKLVKGSKPIAWIFDAPQRTGSVYHEGAVLLTVKYRGVTGYYVPYIWGDNDELMLLNREVYGWPQLFCDHDALHKDENSVWGIIARRGETLIKLSVFLERTAKPKELPLREDWLQVRKFPNPIRGKPSIRHLIHTVVPPGTVHELWTGRASLQLGPSPKFTLGRFGHVRASRGFYLRTSFDLPLPVKAVKLP
ncbi:MAG: acetoacetate decarboxylase family protein [Thaumarchaeota archaeon]|nr:acetoacetate decarboxylase family protein [Nitrososphaerota archaeon]